MSTAEIVARGMKALEAGGPGPGLVLATMAFCEALVVIGLFVPLTPLLLAIGAAIRLGVLHPSILVWAVLGAAAGNMASFMLGRRLRGDETSLRRLPPKILSVARTLLNRHGAVSIIVARYLGPPATMTPFLAGWSGLEPRRFHLANLVASLSWPVVMAAIGYGAAVGWRLFSL